MDTPQRYAGLRNAIDAFFEWLSIVVILALFLSSVVIVLQLLPGGTTFTIAGFPAGQTLSYLAQGVILVSVEAAMLGCSTVAKRAKEHGQIAMATKYTWYGIVFLALFILTLCMQVLHVPPWVDTVLLLARCAAGGSYAFFCHGDDHSAMTTPVIPPQQADILATLTEQVNALVTQITTMQQQQATFVDSIHTQLTTELATLARVDMSSRQQASSMDNEEDRETAQKGQGDTPGGQVGSKEDTGKDMPALEGRSRTQDYRVRHPEATYKEIAEALGISIKTVQRHLSGQVDTQTGQQASEVDTGRPQLRVVH